MRFLIIGSSGNTGQALKTKFANHQVHESTSLDLTQEMSIEAFAQELLKDKTPLTGIYFCQGLSSDVYFPKTESALSETELARKIFEVHVLGPSMLLKKLRPLLQKTKIIFVNSGACEKNYPLSSHLVRSSHLTRGLTHELARELGPSQCTVNMIGLGMMERGVSSYLAAETHARFLRHSSIGRLGRFQELADFCYFLGTENSYGTGQVFHFDGGL